MTSKEHRETAATFQAIHDHDVELLRCLIEGGANLEAKDRAGHTALFEAINHDDLECVELLIAAGANVHAQIYDDLKVTPMKQAGSKAIALRLLAAGADPAHLSFEGRRAILGFPTDPDETLIVESANEFLHAPSRIFGRTNPEAMTFPFWESMIRAGSAAYTAGERFKPLRNKMAEPVWSAHRFGQSLTFLPDGRIVQIGGEHEDFYDQDFCIYNDVFVHAPDGTILIFGYPESVFPPTDFHTATLIGERIYVIGSLGYRGTRRFGETPVYALDTKSFIMNKVDCTGNAPGWIFRHRADVCVDGRIRISGGIIAQQLDGKEIQVENAVTFVLDVERRRWEREA